ncbi:MAG: ADP-ribose pyrophosphatase [Anaerolineaceae bacterium]|nr:ADP-ribose pyrophosphatase [Anaerolineaceae bacterium]
MPNLNLLDEIQAIARNGLNYATNLYDRERYERLLALCLQEYEPLVNQPAPVIQAAFFKEMGHITPKVGTDAAIFNEQGQILLMDRVDGSGWCLPCGWLEPNETPAQAIVREVKEETGLDVNVTRLVGVFTRFPETDFSPHTMVAVVHLCEVLGGELTLSHEGLDLKYWDLDAPIRWHANHAHYARMADQCRRLGDGFQAVSA